MQAPLVSRQPAGTEDLPPAVRRQAVEWLVELQSDTANDEARQRWQQWRAAHPDHERAWQRVEVVANRLRHIPAPLAHTALLAPKVTRRRKVVTAVAITFLGTGTAWTLRNTAPGRPWRADKRTGAGEQARMTLPDGTLVELNSGTAVAVRFSNSERALHLLEGEVLVTTAHDPQGPSASRPFIVRTSQGSLRALGTRFSVRELSHTADAEVHLAVFEGSVEVRPAHATGSPRILSANEQTYFTRDAIARPSPTDEASIAWTEGLIVAQDMPLVEFLAELARHRPGYLGCAASVEQLRVSGVYPLADTDRVLTILESALPVKIRRVSRYWVSVQPKGT